MNKIFKKLIAIIMLFITMLGIVQPVFAVSGSGTYIGGQYASGLVTTDGSSSGIIIRKLINSNTGEKWTVFCAEHGIPFSTDVRYAGNFYAPENSSMKEACKIAYFGWYSKFGDYVVDGGILSNEMIDVKYAYVFTQQFMWESLGQSNGTFVNPAVQSEYEAYKQEIRNKMNAVRQRPSFDNTTITIQAGETKELHDTNGALSSYASIDRTENGIRIRHTRGENSMYIDVSENVDIESYTITDNMFLNWGMIKEDTINNDTTVYFEFPNGVQDQLYAYHYNDPVTLRINMNIELFGKLELSKLNTNNDLIDGAVYRVLSTNGYSNDVEVRNGKITIEKLKKGTYTIRELNAPNGYLVDYTTYGVEIRTKEVTSIVSQISSIIPVRTKLVEIQRKLAIGKNVIVEGRDIGTVVFPNADLKIYLDADEEVRAKRRYEENIQKGMKTTYEEVLENVRARDYNDIHKPVGALKKADDAIVIDSTKLTIDEVVEKVKELIKTKTDHSV